MQIQIINVEKEQKSTSTGRGYVALTLNYKNLTYGNKVESRKIMPFGSQQAVHKLFSEAQSGQVYDTVQGKNDKGYNEFVSATLNEGGAASGSGQRQQSGGAGSTPARPNTFETPEERAKKQVYIVRQSSISSAVALLSVGSKASPTVDNVIEAARKFEAYVFGTSAAPVDALDHTGFEDMDDDIPF